MEWHKVLGRRSGWINEEKLDRIIGCIIAGIGRAYIAKKYKKKGPTLDEKIANRLKWLKRGNKKLNEKRKKERIANGRAPRKTGDKNMGEKYKRIKLRDAGLVPKLKNWTRKNKGDHQNV